MSPALPYRPEEIKVTNVESRVKLNAVTNDDGLDSLGALVPGRLPDGGAGGRLRPHVSRAGDASGQPDRSLENIDTLVLLTDLQWAGRLLNDIVYTYTPIPDSRGSVMSRAYRRAVSECLSAAS